MPHCILDYSANVPDRPDFPRLLESLHRALAGTGEFAIGDFKGRAVEHRHYAVAGGGEGSFVALQIRILDGRSDEIKARVSDTALALLLAAFPRASDSGRCSFSVEIVDMHRGSYRRSRGGG